jgi:hypothetical protein
MKATYSLKARKKSIAKAKQLGEKISNKHFDLLVSYGGSSTKVLGNVDTKNFKEFLLELHIPVETNVVALDAEQVIADADGTKAELKVHSIDKLNSKVISKLGTSYDENGELILHTLKIFNNYLPEDNNAPDRALAIAQEYLRVVNQFHKEFNEVATRKYATSALSLRANCIGQDAEGNDQFDYSSAILRHKSGPKAGQEYTEDTLSKDIAIQTIYELTVKPEQDVMEQLYETETMEFTGEYFSNVKLQAKIKGQEMILNLVSVEAEHEAVTIANEITPYLDVLNLINVA